MTPFSSKLLRWYSASARDLPWRRTSDPYKIWISEIMLQQTTVNAVIPYYKRWFEEFPDVQTLSKAPLEKVLKVWQGLGYYSRARNVHKTAQILVSEHNGKLPQDPKVVRQLPGFGPYTVGSVLSIAYGLRLPIIDANVRRVIMRISALEGEAVPSQDKKVLPFLEDHLPARNIGNFNQALMEIGALICRSKEPVCTLCPVRTFCRAYEEGKQEIIPTPKKRIIKDIEAVIAIIKHRNKYLIQQRPEKGLLAGLWEFPGGKMEKGEDQERALKREIKEELATDLQDLNYLFDVTHFYTQFRVLLHVWECRIESRALSDSQKVRWVTLEQMYKYPMPSGSAKILDKLH